MKNQLVWLVSLMLSLSVEAGINWDEAKIRDLTTSALETAKPDALIRALRAQQSIVVIEHLLNNGFDVNIGDFKKRPPVCMAARIYKNSTKMVEFLISKGANPLATDINGNNALHRIAKYNPHIPLAQILLDAGLDPDAKNKFKKTPRKLAIKKGYLDLVELFDDGLSRHTK
jgi:ankyrin repeat protein